MKWKYLCCLLVLVPATVRADVSVARVFSDNMVLQRDKSVAIWGTAKAGEKVTVTLGGKSGAATTDAAGQWRVTLPALSTARGLTLTVQGRNRVTRANVAVGEVWICSGQSNMATTVEGCPNGPAEVKAAAYPDIRLGNAGGWRVCTPAGVARYSSVAYFYARALHEKLRIPVGVMTEARPGSSIQSMTPFAGYPLVDEVFERYAASLMREAEQYDQWADALAKVEVASPNRPFVKSMVKTSREWAVAARQSLKDKTRYPARPNFSRVAPKVGIDWRKLASLLPKQPAKTMSNIANNYKSLRDVEGYTARGFVWYQGESNQYEGTFYYHRLKALIRYWRTIAWTDRTMPFYIVQIAPNGWRGDLPALWEAQWRALDIPLTELAHTCDVGYDLHPKNKQVIAERVSRIALAKTYGHKDILYRGPRLRSMAVADGKIRVEFDHVARGLKSRDGKPLAFFEIAGTDGKFVKAEAVIAGGAVVVRADSVKAPKHVRFAWHKAAVHNLVNSEGLPAYPFRTAGRSFPVPGGAELPRLRRSAQVPVDQPASNVGQAG